MVGVLLTDIYIFLRRADALCDAQVRFSDFFNICTRFGFGDGTESIIAAVRDAETDPCTRNVWFAGRKRFNTNTVRRSLQLGGQ